MRLLTWILFVLGLAAASGAAQLPARAQDPADRALIEAAVATTRERLAQATLEAVEVERLSKELDEAATWLQTAAAAATRADEFARAAAEAPALQASIAEELAHPPVAVEVQRPEGADLAALEAALQQAEADLTVARQRLAELEAEAQTRDERRRALPDEIATQRATLGSLREEAAAIPALDDLPGEVRRLRARAQLAAAQERLRQAEQELASYDARRELLPKRRQRAQRRVTELEQAVAGWRALVTAEREAAARRARDEAARLARQAVGQHPIVQAIVKETQELLARETGPQGYAAALARHQARRAEVQQGLDELQRSYVSTRNKLAVAGLSDPMGRVLREQYQRLPRSAELTRERRTLRRSLGETQFAQLEIEERYRQVDDIEPLHGELLAQAQPDLAEGEQEAFEVVLREALRGRAEQLDRVNKLLKQSTEAQEDRLHRLEDLLSESADYRRFIEENVLYVRSVLEGRLPRLDEAVDAARWALSPAEWQHALRLSWTWYLARPGPPTLLVLLLIALAAGSRRLLRGLDLAGESVRRFRTDSFAWTVKALALTGLLALPLPLVLWLAADLLGAPEGQADVARTVAVVADFIAPRLLVALAFLAALRSDGLVEAHLRWPEPAVRRLRRELRWVLPCVAACAFVSRFFEASPEEAYRDSLGRLAFVIQSFVLAWFAHRTLRAGGPVLAEYLRRNERSALARSHPLWSRAVVGLLLAQVVMSLLGYHYTALQFWGRLLATAELALLLMLVRSLLTRWQYLARRRLAVEQARTRARARAEAEAAAAEEEGREAAAVALDEDAVDIPAVDAQTKRLFNGAIAAALAVGLYLIWAGMLPALSVLERVEIWPRLRVVDEFVAVDVGAEAAAAPAATAAEGAPAEGGSALLPTPLAGSALAGSALTGSSLGQVSPGGTVSLGDAVVALIVFFFTGLLARNVPGLLEIGLLQRLPLDAGARYAVTTIVRYLILLVGITAGMGSVGIGWSTVQWLAAALTFGLAFGMQEIFANFVSGIIILIERPIRVGDFVTVDGTEGQVTRLRMRATTITDWDRRELLVPNKSFITSSLINWTLTDPVTRIVIAVGVAYGSDVRLAQATLLEVARACEKVLDDPKPSVVFREFGDSSLLLHLRVFLPHRDVWPEVTTALHLGIDDAFRERGIEIAFPQRDLHVRSADPSLGELLGRGE